MSLRPDPAATRSQILDRAMALFSGRGYDATSLSDIAVAVGCSKATILYHFDGKQAVLHEAIAPAAAALAELVSGLRADLAARPDERADVQRRAIDGLIDLVVHHRGLLAVVHEISADADHLPDLGDLVPAGERLPELLAADDRPLELAMARFALLGLLAHGREAVPGTASDTDWRSDDDSVVLELRTAMHRLLTPLAALP